MSHELCQWVMNSVNESWTLSMSHELCQWVMNSVNESRTLRVWDSLSIVCDLTHTSSCLIEYHVWTSDMTHCSVSHELWESRLHVSEWDTNSSHTWYSMSHELCVRLHVSTCNHYRRVCHDPCITMVTWLFLMCDVTQTYLWHLVIYSPWRVYHDSFVTLATWLILMCDVTQTYLRHDPTTCVPWPIHYKCYVTHSHMRRDSDIYISMTCGRCIHL